MVRVIHAALPICEEVYSRPVVHGAEIVDRVSMPIVELADALTKGSWEYETNAGSPDHPNDRERRTLTFCPCLHVRERFLSDSTTADLYVVSETGVRPSILRFWFEWAVPTRVSRLENRRIEGLTPSGCSKGLAHLLRSDAQRWIERGCSKTQRCRALARGSICRAPASLAQCRSKAPSARASLSCGPTLYVESLTDRMAGIEKQDHDPGIEQQVQAN